MLKATIDYLTFELLKLNPASPLGQSVNFFIYDSIKILLLLLIVTNLMSLIRYYLPLEKIRDFLSTNKLHGLEYFLAAGFGAITPFCSCSSIPLFIGFLGAGIPLGVTLAFLITSPLVNEVGLALFIGLFGWKITIIYAVSGIIIGVSGGYILGKLKLEKYVASFVRETKINQAAVKTTAKKSIRQIAKIIWQEAQGIIVKILPYILAGVAIGAIIHGYVPHGYFEKYLGKENFWAVPLAVILAVPLYSDHSGIIPIIKVLIDKGIPLGTAMAFMMATVGLSLPEAMILKKIMRWQLLTTFFGVVTLGIIILGYLFNLIIF
ncbi:MAG: permease [Patescibacteria group bacterium]|jgi:uncharacterized membrane protein YraQ (UPF0718 family)|nr:permease [Patescibacteria group bacterium]